VITPLAGSSTSAAGAPSARAPVHGRSRAALPEHRRTSRQARPESAMGKPADRRQKTRREGFSRRIRTACRNVGGMTPPSERDRPGGVPASPGAPSRGRPPGR
jgi:hypothetical protein